MSSTQSSSVSSISSDSELPRRRPSLFSPTLPRRTISSSSQRRGPLPPRTVSAGSEDWNETRLSSTHLSQIPSQGRELTGSEFLREDFKPQTISGSEISAEARRQTIIAMDRKRRLTSSGHDGGRRRTTQGGFHDRLSSGQSFRFDGPSSPRQRDWPERMEPRDLPGPQVIDLTESSPISTPASVSLMPTLDSISARSQQTLCSVPSRVSSSSSRRYTVPRWQPDSETSECPICGRTFGILFRRHHCRKCGKVVCNDCSPHRITIPRSLIVNPPGPGLSSSPAGPLILSSSRVETVDLTGDDDDDPIQSYGGQSNKADLEGGAKVRLCNPCVPDPQPEPQEEYSLRLQTPRAQTPGDMNASFSGILDRRHQRHHNAGNAVSRQTPESQANGRNQDMYGSLPRNRPRPYEAFEYDPNRNAVRNALYSSSTSRNHQSLPQRPEASSTMSASLEDRFSRIQRLINASMTPPSLSSPAPPNFSATFNHTRYQSLDSGMRSEAPGSRPRVRPMLEVDPNIARMMGIATGHSSQSSEPPQPQYRESDICPICRHLLPPRGADGDEADRESHIMECISARNPTSAHAVSTRAEFMEQLPPRAPIQMVPFVATEKDCLGEDGNAQECSICMVEYDEGDELARLECLCKFHKECIVSWFSRKQECPLHRIA